MNEKANYFNKSTSASEYSCAPVCYFLPSVEKRQSHLSVEKKDWHLIFRVKENIVDQ